MELVSTKTLQLFSGSGNRELAEEIAESLGVPLGHVELSTFANGEKYCRLGENVRGSDVFVVQGHCEPINDHVMEQLIMIDALKRASARRITAVCPFYGYARQDRKATGPEPITARLLPDLFTVAGAARLLANLFTVAAADRLVALDLHPGQIQGFFDFPVDPLPAGPLLADHLATPLERDVAATVVSPDAGAGKLARRFANCLDGHGIH